MVLWEPRLHGAAVGWLRVTGTEALHRDVFGLHSCERQAGSGRSCAKHTSLEPAVQGVSARHPAQGARTAFASCSHRAGSQPFYLKDVQTPLPLSISPSQDISLSHLYKPRCSLQSSRSTTQRCAQETCEPQKKLAAGKKTSPPALPALSMQRSKASITWRHIPVDGARTSQSSRTAQSYPPPFSNRWALKRD